ncbi:MAG: hypothetical protein K8U03_03940 [Planctomycetia bacterium]|nr:hypothetical protein [Planctomycetia bacterium]
MVPKCLLKSLFFVALLLPAAILTLAGMGRLLFVLGDTAAAGFVERLVLLGCTAWVLDLLGLLLAVAARLVGERGDE